jgi:toluene monooxygenase system protein E
MGDGVLRPLPTWSHLAGARRRPTEYEVVSVGLHYHTRHPECPFELDRDFFFQAADEARLVQRIAYRTAELRERCPGHGFGVGERRAWEDDPVWQGFRELLEKALVAWDWGESFVAVNLVAKPALDEVSLRQLTAAAARNGDELLGLLCESHRADVQRSRRWTAALIRHVLEGGHNRAVIKAWLDRWTPLGDRAARVWLAGLPGLDAEAAAEETRAACQELRAGMGL